MPTEKEWSRLTRDTEDAILAHNEFGEALGCWTFLEAEPI